MSSLRGIFSRLGLSDSASSSVSNLSIPAPGDNVDAGRSQSPRPSLIDRLRIKADGSSGGLAYAPSDSDLFTVTKPEVDGEECLLDCSTCSVKYPTKFKVENDKKLYGHVKAWDRHILIATGKSDWVNKIHTEKGSLAESIDSHVGDLNGKRTMLSASNIPIPNSTDEHATRIILLPSFSLIDNVTPKNFADLIPYINSTPMNSTSLGFKQPASSKTQIPSEFKLTSCPHNYIVLLCSHKTRDARCGQSAPLIRKELERHLRGVGLLRDLHDERPGGVGIYFVSHVGGHKFAANVIVYRRKGTPGTEIARGEPEAMSAVAPENRDDPSGNDQVIVQGEDVSETSEAMSKDEVVYPGEDFGEQAAQCIWLARVRPEDCENIVRYTIMQGKVVKPTTQLRGGFDRSKQLASW